MLAAVEDVHHRHGQRLGAGAAQIAVQGQVAGLGGGLGHRHADAQNRIGAQLGLVGCSIQVDHELVDGFLVAGVEADQFRGDLGVDVLDGLGDALAEVDFFVIVAQLDGFVLAGAGAAGHAGPAQGPVLQHHVHLDGGVAAGIEDLPALDEFNAQAHG